MNEDRARFLTALGLGFCTVGNHVITDGTVITYEGQTFCDQHPCPAGPTEGPIPGYCDVGRIHFAKDGVYWMPRFEKWACPRHLRAILLEAVKRGLWNA